MTTNYDRRKVHMSPKEFETMADLISLTCINCGGALEIEDSSNFFYCNYCGHKHALKTQGKYIQIESFAESLDKIHANTDRTASELAIVRLTQEMNDLRADLDDHALLNSAIRIEVNDVTKSLVEVIGKRYTDVTSMRYTIGYAKKYAHLIDVNALVADYFPRIDKGRFNFNKGKKIRAFAVLKELQGKVNQYNALERELETHKKLVKI